MRAAPPARAAPHQLNPAHPPRSVSAAWTGRFAELRSMLASVGVR